MKTKRPVIAIVLDGVGIRKEKKDNPMYIAKMPFFHDLLKKYPNKIIQASEEYVGLPKGQMGNSEVGHLTLGAGRVLLQDLMRINKDISDHRLETNKVFNDQIKRVKTNNSTIHLIGMVSNGGVHSSIEHLFALIKTLSQKGVQKVKVHCILDGRDTPVDSGKQFLQQLQIKMNEYGVGEIATLIGRFYAMDREERWSRTETAFNLFCYGKADRRANTFGDAFKEIYGRQVSDEFAPAYAIGGYVGMQDNDEVLFFNFRPDRMRQLTNAFATRTFITFNRGKMPKLNFVAMCRYDKTQRNIDVLFDEIIPKNTLSERLSMIGYKQLKLAETTKYAHVTYYFNGGIEKPFKNEKRILIESKNVDNFAEYPPMRAPEITECLLSEIWKSTYDFILVNYSNGDMIGHTGDMDACVKTLEILDTCLEKVVSAANQNGYTCFIVADHGNVEDEGGVNKTTHTTNPVPFIITDRDIKLREGTFALDSFAPTILDYMRLYKPREMLGESMLEKIPNDNS